MKRYAGYLVHECERVCSKLSLFRFEPCFQCCTASRSARPAARARSLVADTGLVGGWGVLDCLPHRLLHLIADFAFAVETARLFLKGDIFLMEMVMVRKEGY